ncbi:hypothetical protein MAP00_009182 [Monascus purpureus]|nr:hypothetical protein MAP00_009182 [Monascus purpureus]
MYEHIITPPTPKTGIIDIYDIFGLSPQTLQGADILSRTSNAVVLVPDFLKGNYVLPEWIPPDTEEKKKQFTRVMSESANPAANAEVLLRVVEEAKRRFPSVTAWGGVGLCWGGKVTALASGPGTPFAATGQVHPGLLDKADAERLTIPHIVLASKDESAQTVADYKTVIASNEKGGHVETYGTMWHGWMGTRANLENEDSRNEYARGYGQLAEFFKKYLE